MKLYQLAGRNVLRNKRRSILSGVAIAISVMIIIIMYSFINGMIGDMKGNIFKYVSGHVKIENKDYEKYAGTLPLNLGVAGYKPLMEKISAQPDVKAVTPRIRFGTLFYGSPRIAKSDIKDYEKLVGFLKDKANPVSSFLTGNFPEKLRGSIYATTAAPDSELERGILDGLDNVMRKYNMNDAGLAKSIALSDETKSVLGSEAQNGDTFLVNRMLLEDALPGILEKNPRLGKTYGALGYGLDFEREKSFISPEKYLIDGVLPAPDSNGMLLSTGLAESMKLSVGDKLSLLTTTRLSALAGMTFRITGIVRFPVYVFNQKSFFLPLAAANDLLQMDGSVTEILILGKNENAAQTLSLSIGTLIKEEGLTNISSAPWQATSYIYSYIQLVNISINFMSLFFFLLGTTVIINTTLMVIYERIREIGTVSALGMKGSEIVRLFFLEAFYIGAVAALAGVVIGLLIVFPMNKFGFDMQSMARGVNYEISSKIYPSIDAFTVIIVYLYAVIVTSFVSFIPSRRASKIEPVEALRSI